MKKYSLLGIIVLPIFFSSCTVTKKSSNNNIAENKSPKFLNGSWISSEHRSSVRSKNNRYGDSPKAINNNNNNADNNSAASEMQYKYASLLEISPNEVANPTLIKLIDDWYGTPYQMGGNTKDGIDCSGFSKMLLDDIYAETIPRTAQQQYDNCKHIKKDKLQEGDLVFFHTIRGGDITHVGVYLQNNKFVHASSSKGVMISDLNDSYWRKAYRGSGRVKENDE